MLATGTGQKAESRHRRYSTVARELATVALSRQESYLMRIPYESNLSGGVLILGELVATVSIHTASNRFATSLHVWHLVHARFLRPISRAMRGLSNRLASPSDKASTSPNLTK
jgi:hypothetical protein